MKKESARQKSSIDQKGHEINMEKEEKRNIYNSIQSSKDTAVMKYNRKKIQI